MVRSGWAISWMVAVLAITLSVVRVGSAELVSVPVDRQAELLARVAGYDRNMVPRAGDRVRVLLIPSPSDPVSVGIVRRMEAALGAIPGIAGMAHDDRVAPVVSAADLSRQSPAHPLAILFLVPLLT